MWEPFDDRNSVVSGYRYKGIPVHFTFTMAGDEVSMVDVYVAVSSANDAHLMQIQGVWESKEAALKDAQNSAAEILDAQPSRN